MGEEKLERKVARHQLEKVYIILASTGHIYVGQSVDVSRRLGEWARELKGLSYKTIEVLPFVTKDSRREVLLKTEQLVLDLLGGDPKTRGRLVNKVNPIGLNRLDNVKLQVPCSGRARLDYKINRDRFKRRKWPDYIRSSSR